MTLQTLEMGVASARAEDTAQRRPGPIAMAWLALRQLWRSSHPPNLPAFLRADVGLAVEPDIPTWYDGPILPTRQKYPEDWRN